ncbi:four helix bundle protein [Bythopirellula goksoeyrii]|uniref:Four helix bundle protein n=1 Tax=Bythopirellula goksoeyrii TaxID=1400387 RepID=A0A5B9Q1F4_9BACT|nr:four helix bundle protein [Bythopirellula goksoeyrii]QEG32877.1 hypothetical protein Pr1d_01380 [Bythopirellula goksoeyrii]
MAYESRFRLDDFELYKQARDFRKRLYVLINSLPSNERFALADQMRRAAISISNNIAEGHGRWYYQQNIRFCRISRGSIEEVIDDLNICFDENHASEDQLNSLKENALQLIARINSYIAYLRKSKQGIPDEP